MKQFILLICSLLFSAYISDAQIAMPDSACSNAVRHYYVDPNPFSGSTYIWKVNGVTQDGSTSNEIDITWTNAGNYLLEVQEFVESGCPGPIISGRVIVSDVPIGDGYSNSPICEGSSINLTAQTIPQATYLWTGPNGYSSSLQNSLIPSASLADKGSYFLSVSINGCSSEPTAINVIVNTCTGVQSNDAAGPSLSVSIYPNPSAGLTNFIVNGASGNTEMEIYSINGQKIYSYNISGKSETQIDLSNLPRGIYMVKIIDEKTNHIDKLILQ